MIFWNASAVFRKRLCTVISCANNKATLNPAMSASLVTLQMPCSCLAKWDGPSFIFFLMNSQVVSCATARLLLETAHLPVDFEPSDRSERKAVDYSWGRSRRASRAL